MPKSILGNEYSNHGVSYKQSSSKRVCITISKQTKLLEEEYKNILGTSSNRSQIYSNYLKTLINKLKNGVE
ncbi:hypothetical protein [Mycoplasma capricolum]|uniref:Uncharacterized protein n=1 Tax=Mycoplasma capricolum subsp. capripneumoniae 87001 TaxID=1124992 RepID=A0A9N7B0K0_MYCCC|nr:hypothetical protein [Mycoplasma capricolum]AJK51310.1 hypothetical protein MCCG_0333 [Mycoplasma capricolum subsp. capripneumoniae 87001]AOQ22015.1 hypothetical protein M1601_01490 [Mycoplasma capricolum subsp. capripneumoniae M1601]AQU77418.1 hypothetical protein BVA24_01490 [Mycoplasma capricolum subsp. capripneumoniae]QIN42963.1 hypothetical protein FOY63_01475 [Mycoplasma capricolum subsp. capripneumoniae]QIN43649.1 hypothetical protein FOY64_01480 [Mycoplasma capricolum subsp. capripn